MITVIVILTMIAVLELAFTVSAHIRIDNIEKMIRAVTTDYLRLTEPERLKEKSATDDKCQCGDKSMEVIRADGIVMCIRCGKFSPNQIKNCIHRGVFRGEICKACGQYVK